MAAKNFDEQLTGEGFKRIATFCTHDFVDKIIRGIPDLQEYDFRILPMYIALGIEMENASPEEKQHLPRATILAW